ncbi:MAG: Smr/MutS family protein [Bacteroidales bacterium]|jgi:DNA mismatch repair protein MutS2|nr:Smr/MutS family protein [Bacteroidales bacterium]
MIYPHTFEEKTGFIQLRSLLSDQCVSEMARERVESLSYSSDFQEIKLRIEQTEEFRSVLLFEDPFPAQEFYDLRPVFQRIHIDGTFIELEELVLLRGFINAITQVFVYFRIQNDEEKYPRLWDLCKDIQLEKNLLESINKVLDPKGNLRDNASDELRRIKREIIRVSGEADKKIRKILLEAKQNGLVKEDAEMTIRNGRVCIPVPSVFKRRMQGFIHDESATGQTVFIEPTAVFDANNALKDLINAEKREIIRILTELSNEIRPAIPNLMTGHDFIGEIDFIRAKAKLAIEIKGIKPNVLDDTIINWQDAVHPLLFLNFKGTGKKVVSLSLQLTKNERVLIISGPNAGGKSVCLKTVGLLQYMLQCGLLVPMKETSDMGVFEDFFIDIGDEQSIDNDLSTYSSHLYNLKTMIEHLNAKSLFLIDEFGSGTEPVLGGAMAESILERIYDLQPFGIITTHFGNLKVFPDTHKEAINGAMLFDTQALKPLFILKVGKPGSSFTYEIARQIGLPSEIINTAIQKSGTAQIDYEKKLEDVELEKIEIDKTLKLVHNADDQLAAMIQEYTDKYNLLEKQRKDILTQAKNQAISIIDNANKLIEKTIRDIKEAQAEPVKTKEIRKEVAEQKEVIKQQPLPTPTVEIPKPVPVKKCPAPKIKPETAEDTKIKVGDLVFMADTQITGEVMILNGRDITIGFNSISLRTTIDKVIKISKKEARTVARTSKMDGTTISEVMNRKVAEFNHTLDLRGKRADEAVEELETYVDEVLLLGVKQVKILHGKGNGILRHVVRQALGKRKEVRAFRDEMLELGGAGITVVEM